MKFLKKLFSFYVFSNLHVAFAGFSLTKITELSYNINNSNASLFVGFAIILSYNFIRYYELKTDQMVWFRNWFTNQFVKIKWLSIFSLIGLAFQILKGDFTFKALLFLLPFSFMTLFYVIPLFKIGEIEVSFRNFPLIKIFSIAFAWAGVTVLLPIVNIDLVLEKHHYLDFLARFLFLIAIIIPFDIRDLKKDHKYLKTIPQLFGIKGAKIIGMISIFLSTLLLYINSDLTIDVVLIGLITILFLFFSSFKRNKYYASFFVESIPILWLIIFTYFR